VRGKGERIAKNLQNFSRKKEKRKRGLPGVDIKKDPDGGGGETGPGGRTLCYDLMPIECAKSGEKKSVMGGKGGKSENEGQKERVPLMNLKEGIFFRGGRGKGYQREAKKKKSSE